MVKYLADTIVNYIWHSTNAKKGTFRFVLPAYPSNVLVHIGTELTERIKRCYNKTISLSYGVAYRLGKEWEDSADPVKRQHYQEIRKKGWYNDSDNLTSLRNQRRVESIDCLIVILAGYEHIHDKESLRDFFRLDQANVWNICLKRQFIPWIEDALRSQINPDDCKAEFAYMDEFLRTIYDLGLSDLTSISLYLESRDFRSVSVSRDACRIILEKLDDFGLPNLIGLQRGNTRKKARDYIAEAQSFFNYSMFLDESNRKKSKATIEKYWKNQGQKARVDGSLEGIDLGSYQSLRDLLDALEEYIEYGNKKLIPELKKVDFVFILDSVLGYREKRDPNPKKSAKRITDKIPEVFLNALWNSLGEFKREQSKGADLAMQKLTKISLIGGSFRHDFDSESQDDGFKGPSDKAKEFLTTLLGGVDEFLEERVVLDRDDPIEINSKLLPNKDGNEFKYQRSMRAEPQFRFAVILETTEGYSRRDDYVWPLPHNHHSRLLISLYKWVEEQFEKAGNALPVYSAPFVPELFLTKDKEEAARLLELCIGTMDSDMIDLRLVVKGLDNSEENKILALSYAYQEFIKKGLASGFYSALKEQYSQLRKAYSDLLNNYLSKSDQSVLGPLLFKAFLLLPDSDAETGSLWNEYLTGAVVTPLHPAMIDMMYHQSIYLCRAFSESVEQALKGTSARVFAEKYFNRLADLSRILWPLYGILSGVHKNLDTNSRTLGYIQMIGDPTEGASKLGAKVLLEEDTSEEDDDEITDSGLFRETRTSQLIFQTLLNYCELYPFAQDGINIATYCGGEIQPLIAGIDEYLKSVMSEPTKSYSLRLTVFSDGIDDYSILRWIDAWKERWQVAELSSGKQHYENCQISIRYKVINRDDDFDQFGTVISEDNYDVFLFMDFIKSTASRFQVLKPINCPDDYQKFPIVERVTAPMIGGGKESQRERVLSNQRFQLNALHAEVMASVQQPNSAQHKHVIVSTSDYEPWVDTVNTAHRCSAWVVCIDPSVDDQLLRLMSNGLHEREIIAFGTGVGSNGEKNFTISTDQFSIVDIEDKIANIIALDLGLTDKQAAQRIAMSLVREAINVAGLSIVKATGGTRFVRELIANAVTRKILPKDNNVFCDELISLDAYLHWFDDPTSQKRPDLLRIHADIVDGYFEITLQLVECKLAKQSEGYLEAAREQIESGLRELVEKFKPRTSLERDCYARVDQRYWWMQLHRLISTNGSTTKAMYKDTLAALEHLSEGFFTVRWQAGVFAIWTDQQIDQIFQDIPWQHPLENEEFPIMVATTGIEFVKKVSLRETGEVLFVNVTPVEFLVPSISQGKIPNEVEDEQHAEEPKEQTLCIAEDENAFEQPLALSEEIIQPSTQLIIASRREHEHGFERIFLGSGTAGGRDAYWEFEHPNLPNRHILVFGASGTGKTYLIQALMCELAKLGRNTLVFDYTQGFTKNQLEQTVIDKLNPTQHAIRVKPLEVNPFRKQVSYIDDLAIEDDPATIASRVSGVFDEVYQLGDQQRSALYSAIRDGVTANGNDFTLRDMIDELEDIKLNGGPSALAAASVISKILPFVDTNPFGRERPESWEHLFMDENSRVHIIQLASFVKNTARLITEFSLIDLYWYYRGHGKQSKPRIIVLDEIQNLSHKLESPLGQFLTEGRKFGISLILATQTLSNLEKEERDRLFQASHKIFFRPADTEIKAFAQILADATDRKADEWIPMLSSLKRGECYSLGYAYNEHTGKLEVNRYFRIKVKSLEERF